MSNYGSDRLALYTFESVFQFIRCWTNLKLVSSGPLQLAEKYFKLYPEEIDPMWGVSNMMHKHLLFNLIELLFYRILVWIKDILKYGHTKNLANVFLSF